MRNIRAYLLILSLFCTLCAGAVFAQAPAGQPWWYTLERGKNHFRSGDYGAALLAFEDARRQRYGMYERMERDFINLLSVSEVRRMGDSLDWVERYARERFYAAAVAALEELYYRFPVETFNNSAAAALAALGRLKQYPEAEYWIGEIYRVEGESGLALAQYRKAYELRGLFENGDFDTELLYTIADIHKIRQEYNEMERTLLLIVQGSLWSDSTTAEDAVPAAMPPAAPVPGQPVPHAEASASFARQAMTRTLEVDGPGRFLAMYRYNNTRVEKAHRLLGFYYAASGRHSRAQEHLMFAFLIQNTVIIEELIRQRYDFSFTDLADLTDWAGRYSLLSAYMEDAQYYKTAYYLGTSLYGNGKALSAGSLWTFLGARSEAGEWQQYAQRQLRNPRVELAVEMP